MDSESAIKREFKRGELESIDAIDRLEKIGYTSKNAEALVEQWGNEEWAEVHTGGGRIAREYPK